MIRNLKNQPSEGWKLTTAPGEYVSLCHRHSWLNCEKPNVLYDTWCRAVPSMQEIGSTQQCTNNSTLSNQQTHRRTSISNLHHQCQH